MGQALPGVADTPVHLNGRLADGASRPGAVGLGPGRGGQGRVRRQGVDCPGGVAGDAARALHEHEGIGQQVLDGLERADRPAELLAGDRVRHGEVDGAAHDAHQVGGGQGQTHGRPGREVVDRERPGLADRCHH